jgi:hypothetical protein
MIAFSEPGYRSLLTLIQATGFQFALFSDLNYSLAEPGKRCFMRHDIDVSLDFALQMAKLEHSMGIRTTYFVMFRSPLYNLLSRHSSRILHELRRLGHQICLHFDACDMAEAQHSIEHGLRFELDALAFLIGEKVTAFSLHQPTPAVIAQRIEFRDVINTYHPEHLRGVHYLSDSNRDWRGKDPVHEITEAEGSLQILTHPLWWMSESSQVEGCWDAAVLQNLYSAQEQLLATERAYGERRRFEIRRTTSIANANDVGDVKSRMQD